MFDNYCHCFILAQLYVVCSVEYLLCGHVFRQTILLSSGEDVIYNFCVKLLLLVAEISPNHVVRVNTQIGVALTALIKHLQ